jgi:hypothetical protein
LAFHDSENESCDSCGGVQSWKYVRTLFSLELPFKMLFDGSGYR